MNMTRLARGGVSFATILARLHALRLSPAAAGRRRQVPDRSVSGFWLALATASALTLVAGGLVCPSLGSERGEQDLAFELEHRVDVSQWLMASASCHNQAVANNTPVYVVVNGRPTWDPRQGPRIIEKQLNGIAKIESEFTKGEDARSVGIRERLNKAKDFYAKLRERMLSMR